MKKQTLAALSLSFALVLGAALVSGCGDDDPAVTGGPIDGTWLVTSLTCDGAAQPIGTFTLKVDNTAGTFVQQFAPNCIANLDEDYAYPDAQTFSINAKTIDCTPNTGCSAIFGGADCPPLPPKTDFTYARNGKTLTFSRTASLPSDPCPTGQKVEFVMEQQ